MKWGQLYNSLNILWHCLSLALPFHWDENWPFPGFGLCWVFQICWHAECSTLTASSFRIWNNSGGIPSPSLALLVVMFPKAFHHAVDPHFILQYPIKWYIDYLSRVFFFFGWEKDTKWRILLSNFAYPFEFWGNLVWSQLELKHVQRTRDAFHEGMHTQEGEAILTAFVSWWPRV